MLDNVQHQEQLAKESASHYAEYSSEKYKQLVNENSQLKTQVRAQKNIIKTLTDELNKCKNDTIK
jgi:predicted RNase H-like nuclease (RuvC/YqgF family)